jgi:hypothetical protein
MIPRRGNIYKNAYNALNLPDREVGTYSEELQPLSDFPAMVQAWTDKVDLPTEINKVLKQMRFSFTFEECLKEDRDRIIKYIQSVVGDDEHTTTNSASLGPLLFVVGTLLSGIKLSQKDCGISHLIGNYAESWIMIPPTADSSFEAVTRRNAGSGVPVTLDTVKMKYLSPVRKQADGEMDLESKFKHLAEAAAWTHRNWFTYDFHQMALVLATQVFDFKSARTFPFLYETEGGCGGLPPYCNIDTAHSMLFRFAGGKATRPILGIMRETVDVHLNVRKPSECFFLTSSHLAQMGDRRWLQFMTAYKSLQAYGGMSGLDIRDLLRADSGSSLPPELVELSTVVENQSATMGSQLSHLRKDGYIMTELDVKMLVDKRQKEKAIFGTRNIGDVIREIEREQQLFKSNYWKVLGALADSSKEIESELQSIVGVGLASESALEHMKDYYKLRASSTNRFTSFSYSEQLRVFKTSVIKSWFERGDVPLRNDFVKTDGLDSVKLDFTYDTVKEAERKEQVLNWLESDDLSRLLEKPLPPGIGPDDARIMRNFEDALNDNNFSRGVPTCLVLISSDRLLGRDTATMINRRSIDMCQKLGFLQIKVQDYAKICLSGYIEKIDHRIKDLRGLNMLRRSDRRIPYYNYLLRGIWYFPADIVDEVHRAFKGSSWQSRYDAVRIHFEYDYPNLERNLEKYTLDPQSHQLFISSGGYLRKSSLTSKPYYASFAATSMHIIAEEPDFFFNPKAKRVFVDRHKHLKLHNVLKTWDTTTYQSLSGAVSEWLGSVRA